MISPTAFMLMCFAFVIFLSVGTIYNKDSLIDFGSKNWVISFSPEAPKRIKEDLIRRMRGDLTGRREETGKKETEKQLIGLI